MLQNKPKVVFFWCLVAALSAGLFYYSFKLLRPKAAPHPEKVRIGIPLRLSAALPILAAEKGFFKQAGLEPEILEYPSGKRVMEDGFLAGEVDVAISTDTPAVIALFDRNDFSIIASAGISANNQRIVARKDKGIGAPGDLRGKKIGTQQDSALDYFAHLFLLKEGLDEKDVRFSVYPIEKLPSALAAGEVDAVVTREPYVDRTVRLLGGQGVIFEAPKLYFLNELVLVSDDFAKQHPEAEKKILRGLLMAEDYLRAHPVKAVEMISKKMNLSAGLAFRELAYSRFRVELSYSLADDMDNIAAWAISHQTFPSSKKAPDFLNFIRPEALRAVNAGAIDLVIPEEKRKA